MKITVLTGGSSPERHVALASAGQVVQALRKLRYSVSVVDTCSGLLPLSGERYLLADSIARKPPNAAELKELEARELKTRLVEIKEVMQSDMVFPVLHGRQGEGGEIQSLLEISGIRFAGSGSLGSALAMDKEISKRLFRDARVPTPDWAVWPADSGAISAIGLPLIVKPSKVGSTVGLSLVESADEIPAAVEKALGFDDEVILEQFVDGREYTVGVLGEEALSVGEIIPKHRIFDYECKYTKGMAREIFPASIEEPQAATLRSLALKVHKALKLRDFSRVDFRLDQNKKIYCLEANTLPGLTTASLLPKSAGACGIEFNELCRRICELAMSRGG